MRLARNLLLAATATVAALAFMATGASAQIEVIQEDGTHCGAVVEEAAHSISGGCEITAVSTANAVTFAHTATPSEVATSSCENEFIANINEDGIGFIDTAETTIHTNVPAGCPLVACEEASPAPHQELEWPIGGLAEIGGAKASMLITFCIATVAQAEGTGTACTILVDATPNLTTHVISFAAVEEPCQENPATELSGAWQTTGSSEIEILHSHYPGDFGA